MVYDTEDPTLIAKMNHEMREIESMEIVGVLKYTAAGDKPAGFGVTLRCRASRDEGACVWKLTMFLSIYHIFLLKNL